MPEGKCGGRAERAESGMGDVTGDDLRVTRGLALATVAGFIVALPSPLASSLVSPIPRL